MATCHPFSCRCSASGSTLASRCILLLLLLGLLNSMLQCA
jgi:hypothetical protein